MPANISQTLFNSIRNAQDPTYQARVPEATRNNIAEYGQSLSKFPEIYNQFAAALIQRIGYTIIRATDYVNHLASHKRGYKEMGQITQEIHIDPIQAEGAYNSAGPNPLGRRPLPNIKAAYHVLDRQDTYCVSIDRSMFMQNFTSWDRVDEFIGKLMNSMYVGAAWDEYLCMRQLITNAISATEEGKVLAKAYMGEFKAKDQAAGQALISALKYLLGDMKFLTNTFNQGGVYAYNRPEDMELFINKDVEPNVDIYTLTGLFHIEPVMYPTKVFPIDTFQVENVMGVLADKEWLQCYDVLVSTEPQRNAQGLFTNFFFHIWQTLSLSPFVNAVVIYGTEQPTEGA